MIDLAQLSPDSQSRAKELAQVYTDWCAATEKAAVLEREIADKTAELARLPDQIVELQMKANKLESQLAEVIAAELRDQLASASPT